MAIQIVVNIANGPPTFGQQASVGPSSDGNLVTITGTTLPSDASSATWQIEDGSSAWGNTYILAIVLADPSAETSIDPGGFLHAGTGNFFQSEPGWSLPASSNSSAGTAWVAVPPPSGCTLTIQNENPNSSETFNTLIYLYSMDIGLWWVESTVTIPVESAAGANPQDARQ